MAQNENIIYVTLTEDRIDEALGVANEIFVREPFFIDLHDVKAPDFFPMKGLLLKKLVWHNFNNLELSTIAIDKTINKVVGIRFTTDFTDNSGPPPDLDPDLSALWQKEDDEWAKSKGEIKPGEWAHWTGVGVNDKYAGQGIATQLYQKNNEQLKGLGYKGALCENTSYFSGRAAEKAGTKLFSKIDYQTYETSDGRRPFARVKPPHVCFQLREIVY